MWNLNHHIIAIPAILLQLCTPLFGLTVQCDPNVPVCLICNTEPGQTTVCNVSTAALLPVQLNIHLNPAVLGSPESGSANADSAVSDSGNADSGNLDRVLNGTEHFDSAPNNSSSSGSAIADPEQSVSALNSTEDFCDKTLCFPSTVPHVACNVVAGIQKTCPLDAKEVPIKNSLKKVIVYMHNLYRSNLALGKLPGFKSASKMLQMVRTN